MRHRFFVFIRAINVGGRRMTNEELLDPFVRQGFEDVAAYQAAGNITFRCEDPDAARPDRLEPFLTAAYGFNPVLFMRTIDDMRTIVEAGPFSAGDLAGTEGRVQVSLLQCAPHEASIAEVLALVPPEDRVVFAGKEWFWLPTTGVSDSQLPIGAIEKIVGPMTIRTLGTLSRMFFKFGA
ncbi:MAG: DUF1697 domain-containing protein [Acidimicrobiia bacterium]